ncbi:MAG TPA: type II toxin-antitoxin system RelE/ParE family toxin [Candidatus Norongarragalinales archaeon]|nr:type II toxin-antitoxin system RelE/ParE family toxin [Candidatus Norongarragalinales archaeon]
MEILHHPEFEKDVKRLDGSLKERLKKAIGKISSNPEIGKPLKHLHFCFSERIENYRLIYTFKENQILLVCFKNRDEVYEFLNLLKIK